MFQLFKHRKKHFGLGKYTVFILLWLFYAAFGEKEKFSFSKYEPRLDDLFKNFTKLQKKGSQKEGYFTNTWAVELHEPAVERDVERIARKHGFKVLDKVCEMLLYGLVYIA